MLAVNKIRSTPTDARDYERWSGFTESAEEREARELEQSDRDYDAAVDRKIFKEES